MTDKLQTIIEKLGKKCFIEGCVYCIYDMEHPILIGDVLEKIYEISITDKKLMAFIDMWYHCGFTKSLQEIGEMKEEILIEQCCYNPHKGCCDKCKYETQLKPEAQELINFLTEIL